ncbi:MAG: hypothetical protein KAJ12_00465, partial [Bacteroidetes bacterium]|nr:hypothetical protein [Bacteroidota bacterium]
MKRSYWLGLVVPIFLLLVSSAAGQVRRSGPISVQEALAEKASRSPAEQKISSMVLQALDALRQAETLRGGSAVFKNVSSDLLLVDQLGRLHLYLYLYPEYDPDHLRSFLNVQGCAVEILERRFHIVQLWVPFEKVEEVAGLDVVRLIRPAERPITQTGSKLSEGDAVMRADVSRMLFAVDGSGIKVGVISDDVDSLGVAVASGDLPPGVQVITTDLLSNQQNEGTAMLEIIHDLAPGAGLAFSTASPTSLAFIQSVRDLAFPGIGNCDIIVDDIIYLSEPVWEDGPLATVVDSVVTFGSVAYFSSAGNQAEVTYVENFASGGPQLGLTDVHLYGFNDPGMLVSLA